MPNLLKNDFGNLVTICPYCNARILLQFQIVDLYIYTNSRDTSSTITLKKVLSKKPENELYIKTLILNSLKKKPFISRIIITKPYYDVITELTKTGFLTNRDLEKLNES